MIENKITNKILKSPDTVHRHLKCDTLFECIQFTANKCYKITSVRKNTVQSVILFVKQEKQQDEHKHKYIFECFLAYFF